MLLRITGYSEVELSSGVLEWTTEQCHELYAHGVNDIHFYTVGAVDSVVEIVKRLNDI